MVQNRRRPVLETGFYIIVALVGLAAAIPLVGLAAAIPLVGVDAWLLELIVSFRLHILIGLVLVALLALVRRYRWIAACLALLALINGGDVAGTIMSSAQVAADNGATIDTPELRVMFVNAERDNGEHDALIAEIGRLDPDVIIVAEATEAWSTVLAGLSANYPFIIAEPRHHAFGMVFLSKYPPSENDAGDQVIVLPTTASWETEPPVAIMARIETDAGPATIVGLHPFPPLIDGFYRVRNEQMDALADIIARQPPPVIAMGDLNATPWSPTLRSFLDTTGLRGPNILATWPTFLGSAGLPIDHILLSRDLTLRSIERGQSVGSDHRPLFAVVTFGGS